MAWDKENDPNTHMKKSEESLRLGLYEHSIKDIDRAIYLSEEDNIALGKKEKLRILNIFIDKAEQHINDNEINKSIEMLCIYIDSSHYVEETDEYVRGIDRALDMLMSKAIDLQEESTMTRLLKWIDKAIDFKAGSEDAIIKLDKFIGKYIKNLIVNSEDEESAIEQIQNIYGYSSKITDADIEDYKMSVYMNFKNYDQIILNIRFKFNTLIQSEEGKNNLDRYKDFVYRNACDRQISELENILIGYNIPKYLVKMRFRNDFNSKYMIAEFKKHVKKADFNTAHDVFNCIEEYFDFLEIDKDILIGYCLELEKYFLGVEYFKHHISENPESSNLIAEAAEFIRQLRGVDLGKEFIRDNISNMDEAKLIETKCQLIESYDQFCEKHYSDYDLKEELKNIKDINILIDFIYYIYKQEGSISLECLSKKLIDNIDNFDDKEVEKVINILRESFSISIDDEIILAQSSYAEGKFEKSLFILNNINYDSLELRMKYLILELRINNYRSIEKNEEALDVCESLLKLLGSNNDNDVLELYVDLIIETKEYVKGIKYLKCLKDYIDINPNQYTEQKKSAISSNIAKLYIKRGNIFLFASNTLKSTLGNSKDHNTKEFMKLGIAVMIIIGLIFQYRMYATGEWGPVSAEAYMKLDDIILERGEELKYKKSIGIKKFPFYAKNPKEKIVIEDTSILDFRDEFLVGIEEGQTDIVLYMDEVEVGRSTIKVSDIRLEDYTIRYEGEPEFVGDVVTPYYEYKFADNRTKEYDIFMESNNNDVIEIDGEDIVAVGLGKATVSITIAGITKYLPFDIREDDDVYLQETFDDESEGLDVDNMYDEPSDQDEDYDISMRDEYTDRMENLEMENASLDESSYDFVEIERIKCEEWKGLLNEVWDVLDSQLSQDEMDYLNSEQRQWVDTKEAQAVDDSSYYDDEEDREIAYLYTTTQLTKERCAELINQYME